MGWMIRFVNLNKPPRIGTGLSFVIRYLKSEPRGGGHSTFFSRGCAARVSKSRV